MEVVDFKVPKVPLISEVAIELLYVLFGPLSVK